VPITVEIEEHPGAVVLMVSGEVDIRSAPELRDRLAAVLAGGADRVVLDLLGVPFLDSTGLSVMVAAHKRLVQRGGKELGVVATAAPVLRVLTVTGLARVFSVHATLDAALAS